MIIMAKQKMNKLDYIAAYADSHDFSAEMEHGVWVEGSKPETDPMVSTSLRLPKSLLDWIRHEARTRHIRHTTLIRAWLEQKRLGNTDLEERIIRLENQLLHH